MRVAVSVLELCLLCVHPTGMLLYQNIIYCICIHILYRPKAQLCICYCFHRWVWLVRIIAFVLCRSRKGRVYIVLGQRRDPWDRCSFHSAVLWRLVIQCCLNTSAFDQYIAYLRCAVLAAVWYQNLISKHTHSRLDLWNQTSKYHRREGYAASQLILGRKEMHFADFCTASWCCTLYQGTGTSHRKEIVWTSQISCSQ